MIKKTQDLTPSKFGLVQITRQRVRPENIKLEKKIQTMKVAKLKRQFKSLIKSLLI
jgi:uncharacterized protein YueI